MPACRYMILGLRGASQRLRQRAAIREAAAIVGEPSQRWSCADPRARCVLMAIVSGRRPAERVESRHEPGDAGNHREHEGRKPIPPRSVADGRADDSRT